MNYNISMINKGEYLMDVTDNVIMIKDVNKEDKKNSNKK